jgi:hypothetical protein
MKTVTVTVQFHNFYSIYIATLQSTPTELKSLIVFPAPDEDIDILTEQTQDVCKISKISKILLFLNKINLYKKLHLNEILLIKKLIYAIQVNTLNKYV